MYEYVLEDKQDIQAFSSLFSFSSAHHLDKYESIYSSTSTDWSDGHGGGNLCRLPSFEKS